jgi:hypothetical protein
MATLISRKEGNLLKRKLPLSHISPLFIRPGRAVLRHKAYSLI